MKTIVLHLLGATATVISLQLSAAPPETPAMASSLTATEKTERTLEEMFAFLPEKAALFNGAVISGDEIRDALPPQLMVMVANGRQPPEEELKKIARHVLEQLINEKVLLEASVAAGFAPDEKTGQAKVQEIEQKVGAEKFQTGLEHQRLTRQEMVDKVARQLAVNHWLEQEIVPQIEVSNTELKQVYDENRRQIQSPEQVRVSHILVKTSPGDDEGAREKAREKASKLQEQILAGANFAEVARLHSDCPSAAKDGDLGLLKHGDTVPEFAEAAFALREGEVSNLVQTQYGYHIIMNKGRIHAHELPFAEVKEKLRTVVRQNKLNERLQEVVRRGRDKAKIQILLPDGGEASVNAE